MTMKPYSVPFVVLVGVLAVSSSVVGFLFVLLAFILFDSFHFARGGHCLVGAITLAGPLLALTGWIAFLFRKTWLRFAMSLLASGVIVLTVLVWISPLARGIIH